MFESDTMQSVMSIADIMATVFVFAVGLFF